MPRSSTDLLSLAPQVRLLASAIEEAGRKVKGTLRGRPRGVSAVATIEPKTVYGALARELGQTPEAVRQELRKYKKGFRVSSAPKVVRLVDAAARLGWIAHDASDTGAKDLVDWCRAECERLRAQTEEADARKRARQLSSLGAKAKRFFDEVLELDAKGRDRLATAPGWPVPVDQPAVAAELVQVIAELACLQMSERTLHLAPLLTAESASLLRDTAHQVHRLLLETADAVESDFEAQLAHEPEGAAMELEVVERQDAERVLVQAQLPGGRSDLTERALLLGIGGSQLERILARLHTGVGLSKDDAARRVELLKAYFGFRPVAQWEKFDDKTKRGTSTRTWKTAKEEILRRRAKKKD